jgi:hypothetical protein
MDLNVNFMFSLLSKGVCKEREKGNNVVENWSLGLISKGREEGRAQVCSECEDDKRVIKKLRKCIVCSKWLHVVCQGVSTCLFVM